ncbi:MAG: hypothetical protein U0V64_01420 [Cyclobacteriaceae bacterium]
MRLRYFLLGGVLWCAGLSVSAQAIYNSVYSSYGVGFLGGNYSALNRGLSGTGIGLQDDYMLNHANPASLNSITPPSNQMFELAVNAGNVTHASSNLSETKSSGGMDLLSYWFRPKPKLAMSFSLSPFSSMNYNVLAQRTAGAYNDLNYQYKGSGGTALLNWGSAYSITKNLSVGFDGMYVFGNFSKTERMQISPSSFLQYDVKTYASRLSFGGGIQWKIPIGKSAIVLGGVAHKAITLKGVRQGTFMYGNSTVFAQTDEQNVTFNTPESYGGGVSFKFRRSTLAADALYRKWPTSISSDPGVTFMPTWRYSAGYTLRGDVTSVSFINTISWRAGVYVEDFYVQLGSSKLTTTGWSVGFSIPVQNIRSAVALTYSSNLLGTTANGLIQESSQRITLDVQVADLWGIRRRFD